MTASSSQWPFLCLAHLPKLFADLCLSLMHCAYRQRLKRKILFNRAQDPRQIGALFGEMNFDEAGYLVTEDGHIKDHTTLTNQARFVKRGAVNHANDTQQAGTKIIDRDAPQPAVKPFGPSKGAIA